MSDTINNPVKEVIDTRIKNLLGEDAEDLTYIHVFFPKINTLLGTEGCLEIHDGQEPIKVFEKVGLDEEDYTFICNLIKEGMEISKVDNSLETLMEIDKKSDILLNKYLQKVRSFMLNSGKSNLVSQFDRDVKNFFGNSDKIFTPCSAFEKENTKKM